MVGSRTNGILLISVFFIFEQLGNGCVDITELSDYSIQFHNILPNLIHLYIVQGLEDPSIILECPNMDQ